MIFAKQQQLTWKQLLYNIVMCESHHLGIDGMENQKKDLSH